VEKNSRRRAVGGGPVSPADRSSNHKTADALMAATERLLVSGGHAALSTRRIAEEAGQPHGLVRYHFGSLEGLVLQTLQRASGEIIERQRALYAGDRPFVEKWRTAMAFVDTDLDDGFPKLAGELFAKSWNDPAYRDGLRAMMEAFTAMLGDAVDGAAAEQGIELDPDRRLAVATLIRTFQVGILIERLAGVDIGHDELSTAIDDWLVSRHGTGDAHGGRDGHADGPGHGGGDRHGGDDGGGDAASREGDGRARPTP
jgi:AcrR family transcriptional regulator